MHSRLVGTIAIATTLVLAVGAAGCGKSKSSSGTTSGTTGTSAALSKPQFLKRGNAICRRGNKAINTAAKKAFPSRTHRPTRAQVKRFAKTTIAITQTEITAVRALPPPSGDEAEVKAVGDAAQKALDQVKAHPELLAK